MTETAATHVVLDSSELDSLPVESAAILAEALRPRVLRGGEVLYDVGDQPDGLVIVDRGRLGVLSEEGHLVGSAGRGQLLGEIGALTGLPRGRTVVALRDTALFELDQHDFDELCRDHRELARSLNRLVVTHLNDDDPDTRGVPATVAVTTLEPGVDVTEATAALRRVAASSAVVDADLTEGRTDAEILALFENLERDHDLVILIAGCAADSGGWSSRCLRQADAVALVVDGSEPPAPAVHRMAVRGLPARSTIELVLRNPAGVEIARDCADWLEFVQPDRRHQVRDGDPTTYDRFARLALGQGVGLVLSGGFAKGLAHIGAYRALNDLGVQIDAVAGVSSGALIGAGVALDYHADQMHEEVVERLLKRQRALADLTFPWIALVQGREVSKRLEDLGAGRSFEETWRGFVCTACDLTTGALVEQRKGMLWQAVRASMSIPGALPPVRSGDSLFVDGAVLENLPVTALRNGHPGPLEVIAVDVGRYELFAAGSTPRDGRISGWRLLVDQVNPRSPDPEVPSLLKVLMRVLELSGDDEPPRVDHHIRPDLGSLGMADIKQLDVFEQAGYDATVAELG